MEPSQIPDTPAALIRELENTDFGPYLTPWIERYKRTGRRRDFLWRWCLNGIRLITLPSTVPALRDHLAETKLLNVIFTTLVDDLVDEDRDAPMFEASLAIAAGRNDGLDETSGFDAHRREYLETTRAIWNELWARAACYPRFADLKPFLEYDYAQIMNAMRYALLVNENPSALSLTEHDLYVSHNLTVTFMGMTDLCASPDFDVAELGAMRALFWEGQRMARIGDTLMTWQREVRNRDASSGVFAYALGTGLFGSHELATWPIEELQETIRRSDFEAYSLSDWRQHREQLGRIASRVRSINLSEHLRAYDRLLRMHLAARGLI